jgi:hypothetical protein
LRTISPCVVDGNYQIVCKRDAIESIDGDKLVARWSDWTQGLKERQKGRLPPPSGQVLLAPRSIVRQFSAKFSANFCWLVRLHVWTREHSYEDYEETHFDRTYGVGTLVVP